jgi:hypothetical protein
MAGVGLSLEPESDADGAAAAAAVDDAPRLPASGVARLISPEWVEQQRRMHTERLNHLAVHVIAS